MCVCVCAVFSPPVHVHAGNIVIDGNNCRLLDIENSLLSLPSMHRHAYSQLHKLHVIIYNIYENKVLLLVKEHLDVGISRIVYVTESP